jgi:hypothetical protein
MMGVASPKILKEHSIYFYAEGNEIFSARFLSLDFFVCHRASSLKGYFAVIKQKMKKLLIKSTDDY